VDGEEYQVWSTAVGTGKRTQRREREMNAIKSFRNFVGEVGSILGAIVGFPACFLGSFCGQVVAAFLNGYEDAQK
jgi:hypothetical protein